MSLPPSLAIHAAAQGGAFTTAQALSAGYDEREKKLVVELTAGTYEYAGVSPEVWRRFSTASSPWSFFRDNIEEEYAAKRVR